MFDFLDLKTNVFVCLRVYFNLVASVNLCGSWSGDQLPGNLLLQQQGGGVGGGGIRSSVGGGVGSGVSGSVGGGVRSSHVGGGHIRGGHVRRGHIRGGNVGRGVGQRSYDAGLGSHAGQQSEDDGDDELEHLGRVWVGWVVLVGLNKCN